MKPRPRTAFDVEEIPGEMIAEARWVNWRAVQRDGKWTKVPVDPKTGGPGKANDPFTWGSFERAVARATVDDVGIGFMLGDGWLGVDLDGIADPEDGAIADQWLAEWARDCGTFVEYSPSGTGLHAVFRGVVVPDDSQNRRGPVEVYDRARFFCISGRALYARPVGGSQTAVDALCARFLHREVSVASPAFEGRSEAPRDDSAVDWKFCCSLAAQGWPEGEIRELLKAKMFHEGREEKATRRDYVERTVANAVRTAGEKPEAGPVETKPLLEIIREHPVQTPYLVHRLLRRGEVGAVIAPPKCRKSFLMHDLAISVATGRSWFGGFQCEAGRVLLVDNELTLSTIADRIRNIVGNMGFGMGALEGRFDCLALREDDRNLDAVLRGILELEQPYDLIIFDALYMFLEKGMDENSNADMTVLLRKFRRFATRTQSSCILVHHTSKGAQHMKETTDYGAGAGALSRAVDLHMAVYRHEEDDTFVARFEVRSGAPVAPIGIQWNYPRFTVASGIDVDELYSGRKKRSE